MVVEDGVWIRWEVFSKRWIVEAMLWGQVVYVASFYDLEEAGKMLQNIQEDKRSGILG